MTTKPVSGRNKKRGPERSEHRKAADTAGISRSRMYQCIQLATIPEDMFEWLVDMAEPPNISQLVEIARVLQGKPPSKPRPQRLKHCPHCGGDLREGNT